MGDFFITYKNFAIDSVSEDCDDLQQDFIHSLRRLLNHRNIVADYHVIQREQQRNRDHLDWHKDTLLPDRTSYLGVVTGERFHYLFKHKDYDPTWNISQEMFQSCTNNESKAVVLGLWTYTRCRELLNEMKSSSVLRNAHPIVAAAAWSSDMDSKDNGQDSWKLGMWPRSRDRTINSMAFLNPEHTHYWGRAVPALKELLDNGNLRVSDVVAMSKKASYTGPFIAQHIVYNLKSYGVLADEAPDDVSWASHAEVISEANTTILVQRFAQALDLNVDHAGSCKKRRLDKNITGYVFKDHLCLETHPKNVIGEYMLRSHRRFCRLMAALRGVDISLKLGLSNGEMYSFNIQPSQEWIAAVTEISAWLMNVCMHERLLQDRYDAVLGVKK